LCPFGKTAQIRKISVNAHKKEDNRPIQQMNCDLFPIRMKAGR